MKIGIPSMGDNGLDEQVGQHFGRVTHYTIIDLDTDKVDVIPNTSHHMGGRADPPEILAHEGVNVLVCQSLGRRAVDLFQRLNIDVYIGASGTVKDAVEAFKEGALRKAGTSDACDEHTFRGEGHRH